MMKNVIIAGVLCVVFAGLSGASYLNLLELRAARDDMTAMQTAMNSRMDRLEVDLNRAFDTQVRHDGIIGRLSASNKELKESQTLGSSMQVATLATTNEQAGPADPSNVEGTKEEDFSHLPQPTTQRDPDLVMSPSQMEEQAQARAIERASFLSNHFETQETTEWSETTVELVNTTLKDESFAGIEVVANDCKAITCRIEIIHSEDEEDDMLINYELLGKLSSELPRMASTRESLSGGKVRTTMYLTRRGESPPRFTPSSS